MGLQDHAAHLNVVVPVVVQIDDPIKLGFTADMQFLWVLHAFAEGLPCVLLHLDVVELSGRKK